jgi:hypothetical protein
VKTPWKVKIESQYFSSIPVSRPTKVAVTFRDSHGHGDFDARSAKRQIGSKLAKIRPVITAEA